MSKVLQNRLDTIETQTGISGATNYAVVAAAGSTSADAAVLSSQFSLVTGADGAKGVALPAAANQLPRYIINTSLTAALKVYPINGGNDNINGLSEDAAFTMGPGKGAWFIAVSGTQWYVQDASGVQSTTSEIDSVCDASARGGIEKVAQVALTATELGGTETNTSFTFPAAGAIFLDAWLNVTDSESGTVDVGTQGTSNDPDGILDGVSVAATGYVGQTANVGALRGKFITGSDPVSVTASGDLNSCAATLFIRYLELNSLA